MGSSSDNISGTRHSGIELLRLVSMLFIVALHINFFAFGIPSAGDIRSSPFLGCTRVLFESFTIVGVDCFILISGWFGIRPKTIRVLGLLYQCAFFCILLYGCGWLAGVEFSRPEALDNLFFLDKWNWFIKSYLALYLLAPVLEAFAKTASEKTYRFVLVAFFVFQSIYGWLFPAAKFFEQGYSAFSFVGLYLLARYIRLFRPRFSRHAQTTDFVAYLFFVSATSGAFVLKTFLRPVWQVDLFAYSSPLVIAASVCLFLFFSKLGFRSDLVNSVARSSYAVYLFHFHPCVYAPLLRETAKHIVAMPLPIPVFLIPGLLVVFLVAPVIVDQLRILSWKRIRRILESGEDSLPGIQP